MSVDRKLRARTADRRRVVALLACGACLAAVGPAHAGGWFSRLLGGSTQNNAAERQAVRRGGRHQAALTRLERQVAAGESPAAALLPEKILAGYERGAFKVVSFDTARGARSPKERASKYVVIEDRAGARHLLGIPTPSPDGQRGRENLLWLHQVNPQHAGHLGRMVRGTLDAVGARVGGDVEAYVNMPGGALTVGTLHVHGVAAGGRARDWAAFERKHQARQLGKQLDGDYRIYNTASGVVVLASAAAGQPAAMNAGSDALVGKMMIEASRAALAEGITGPIALSRRGDRIAVEVRSGFSLWRWLRL